jgi:hypothetical protein
VRELERENELLRRKLAEDKLVTRAKFALIQYLKMTEPQAHRYIEKQAMDLRVTKKEIAEASSRLTKATDCCKSASGGQGGGTHAMPGRFSAPFEATGEMRHSAQPLRSRNGSLLFQGARKRDWVGEK